MPRTVKPPPAGPRSGSGGRGGGTVTQAAEEYAAAMARPGREVNSLKSLDAYLADVATSLEKAQQGLTRAAAVTEEGMPDEPSAADGLRSIAQALAKASQDATSLRVDQHRRNSVDHERLDNRRRNEPGYDSLHPGNNP